METKKYALEWLKTFDRKFKAEMIKINAAPRVASGSGNRWRRRLGDPVDFQHIERWTYPDSYMGEEWPEYYRFLGQNRDSDAGTRANFDAGLARIGGENLEDEPPKVIVVRESHWLCGWVEWIAIHESARSILGKADKICQKLEDYPLVDEDLFSQYEEDEAREIWCNCYNVKERIAWMRKHESQFDFHDLADMLGCARGKYFSGYASELIY